MNKPALTVLLLLVGGSAVGGSALAQGRVSALDTNDGDGSHADDGRNPVLTVIPEYPRQAWLEQIEGGVKVCFYVTRGGRPYSIAVRDSEHKVFERPAREAVKISWFEAIPRSEKVPSIKSCRTFQFRLEFLETDEG